MSPHCQFDGTFEGLLTCTAGLLARHADAAIILPVSAGAADLFSRPEPVPTDPAVAARLSDQLEAAAPGCLHQVLLAFLSEEADIGAALYAYVRLTLERRERVDGFLTHPHVRRVVQTARRVNGERHRLMGLLRFRELRSGVLWSPVEPDANLALLLALHFRRRLSAQSWMVHDVKRHVAVAWQGKELEWLEGGNLQRRIAEIRPDELSTDEAGYQELWRRFFRSIAIPERVNPGLQRRNMPRRYWKHLVEM